MSNGAAAIPDQGVGSRTLLVAFCGGIGGLVATLADIISKDSLSTVAAMSTRISSQLSVAFPPLAAVLVVFVLACVISLLTESNTPQRAFMTGLGVFSFLITATPQQPLPQHPAPPMTGKSVVGSGQRGFLDGHIVRSAAAAEVKSQDQASMELVLVKFRLVADRPTREGRQVTLTVWDAADRTNAGQLIFPRLANKSTPSVEIREISMPLAPGRYVARVEIHGFAIKDQAITVAAGIRASVAPSQTIEVPLTSSAVPIFIQRLTRN